MYKIPTMIGVVLLYYVYIYIQVHAHFIINTYRTNIGGKNLNYASVCVCVPFVSGFKVLVCIVT